MYKRLFDGLRSAPTLYDCSKARVQDVYRKNMDEIVDVLPRTVRDELLSSWLRSDEDWEDEELMETYSHLCSWNDIKEAMSPQIFVMLMSHPFVTPYWASEINHVITRYVEFTDTKNNVVKQLCEKCFISIARPQEPWSGNFWCYKGWQFRTRNYHKIVPGDMIIYEIWNPRAWCSRCITQSLLDIYDRDYCRETTEFHFPSVCCYSQWSSDIMKGNFVSNSFWQEFISGHVSMF